MDTWIVTGGAGFIGCNFVRLALAETAACGSSSLDKLTYAGNLANLADVADDPRFAFVRGDIADRDAVERAVRASTGPTRWSTSPPRPTSTARSTARPPSSHTNVVGTFELLEAVARHLAAARRRRARARSASSTSRPTRSTARSGPSGAFSETTPYAPNSPYSASKAGADHLVRAYHAHLRAAGADHQLLEQLRPLPVPREADPADDPERARGQAAADLRRRRQRARLALRRGPLRGRPAACSSAGRPGEKYNLGGGGERTNLEIVDALCAVLERGAPAAAQPGAARAPGVAAYAELKTFVADRPGPRPPLRDRRAQDRSASSAGGPRHDLASGLAATVRWYLDHRDWCDAVQSGTLPARAARPRVAGRLRRAIRHVDAGSRFPVRAARGALRRRRRRRRTAAAHVARGRAAPGPRGDPGAPPRPAARGARVRRVLADPAVRHRRPARPGRLRREPHEPDDRRDDRAGPLRVPEAHARTEASSRWWSPTTCACSRHRGDLRLPGRRASPARRVVAIAGKARLRDLRRQRHPRLVPDPGARRRYPHHPRAVVPDRRARRSGRRQPVGLAQPARRQRRQDLRRLRQPADRARRPDPDRRDGDRHRA